MSEVAPNIREANKRESVTGSSKGFDEVLVDVKNLKMHFPVTDGVFIPKVVAHVKAVDGVSFQVYRGETLGVVGVFLVKVFVEVFVEVKVSQVVCAQANLSHELLIY